MRGGVPAAAFNNSFVAGFPGALSGTDNDNSDYEEEDSSYIQGGDNNNILDIDLDTAGGVSLSNVG